MRSSSPANSDTIGSSSTSSIHPALQIKIGKRYRLVRRIGGGAFGEVYAGIDLVTEEYVAIKLEPYLSAHQPHLQHEARLYTSLCRGVVNAGIPRLRFFGREGEFNVMVIDLLGPSLEELFEYCGRKFNLKTVCMLADQMIARLEFLHSMSYLHRDLKPENFVMGINRRAHHVYLIDMGLAKRYRDPKTLEHIPFIEGKALTGTARYVSMYTHLGYQQSRRDDLESIGYILLYFVNGALPWQGLRCTNKVAKYEKIKQMKVEMTIDQMCKDLPIAFSQLLKYSRGLKFDETPDYQLLFGLFDNEMQRNEYDHDYDFHWLSLKRMRNASGMHTDAQSDSTSDLQEQTGVTQGSMHFGSPSSAQGSSIFTPMGLRRRPQQHASPQHEEVVEFIT